MKLIRMRKNHNLWILFDDNIIGYYKKNIVETALLLNNVGQLDEQCVSFFYPDYIELSLICGMGSGLTCSVMGGLDLCYQSWVVAVTWRQQAS